MKHIIPAFIFLFPITILLHAQDSIIYENIYRHQLKNGKSTTRSRITKQNTYNLDKNKVISLLYHDSLPNVMAYTLFFYRRGLLFSEETFKMNKNPLSIVRYTYGKNGLMTEEKFYEPVGNTMQCMKTITWIYKDTLPMKKTVRNESGKKASKTVYSYAEGRNTENTRFFTGTEEEHPVSASRVFVYSDGRKTSQQVDTLYSDGRLHATTIKYHYDEANGRLLSEYWYNDRHELVKTVEYKWKNDGTLASKGTYDGVGKCTEFLSYRYESHIVKLGDQKPYELGGDGIR